MSLVLCRRTQFYVFAHCSNLLKGSSGSWASCCLLPLNLLRNCVLSFSERQTDVYCFIYTNYGLSQQFHYTRKIISFLELWKLSHRWQCMFCMARIKNWLQVRVSDHSSAPQCIYFSAVNYLSSQAILDTKANVNLPADGLFALQ